MGRIKTKLIKRVTRKLYNDHNQNFKTTFEENKQLVTQYASIPSKKLRNVIAGYLTRMMRTREEL
ncbi:30S ribosomal protein S17e [Candidatus Woesearchaeota archaeon]|nr:30S ribosomal protein S17e [Candidatus Woesearchaeota archaeon]MBW3014328.1 30S ribosomal protein S17e [Candidatus Woesearchaeota archaeon]